MNENSKSKDQDPIHYRFLNGKIQHSLSTRGVHLTSIGKIPLIIPQIVMDIYIIDQLINKHMLVFNIYKPINFDTSKICFFKSFAGA